MYIQDMNVEEKLSIGTEMIAGRWRGASKVFMEIIEEGRRRHCLLVMART